MLETFSNRLGCVGERSLSGRVPVTIRITDVSSRPPKWVQAPKSIAINETIQRNYVVTTLKAISEIPSNKRIFYELLNGNTLDRNKDQHFLLTRRKDDKGDDIAELVVYKPLDYETTPKYNLTIQAKNDLEPQLDETINVVVEVIDQNDEVPLFERSPVLSILEDEPARTIVGQVKAKDSDIDARFRDKTTQEMRVEGKQGQNSLLLTSCLPKIADFEQEAIRDMPKQKKWQLSGWTLDSGQRDLIRYVLAFISKCSCAWNYLFAYRNISH
ncbi:hypothetical protein RvY_19084 [Ramazzottius varieornatus]|uniref:Cadherin domain-containing protein n=1 Tax=Ramazzottius varieornatus TaxID=947166 RepID=A0A1D1W8B5_RAMVA|nr:hypothetical protein RvY_19084 [Ramazzottius varieornatus]